MSSKKSVTVRQVGHTLVAAYDNANPPLIWKFDLERNHSFSLAMKGTDNGWELGVTSAKDEFHPVARFRSRDEAEEAFSKTQKALMGGKDNRWRTIAIGLIVVLALMLVVVVLPLMGAVHNLNGKVHAASSTSSAEPEMKDGVPLDADQVLKPPP
jgi:predicted nucleic acid-binding Zn ribbon protein